MFRLKLKKNNQIQMNEKLSRTSSCCKEEEEKRNRLPAFLKVWLRIYKNFSFLRPNIHQNEDNILLPP